MHRTICRQETESLLLLNTTSRVPADIDFQCLIKLGQTINDYPRKWVARQHTNCIYLTVCHCEYYSCIRSSYIAKNLAAKRTENNIWFKYDLLHCYYAGNCARCRCKTVKEMSFALMQLADSTANHGLWRQKQSYKFQLHTSFINNYF